MIRNGGVSENQKEDVINLLKDAEVSSKYHKKYPL